MAEQTRCQSARSKRKADEVISYTEKWKKKVQNLKGKIQVRRGSLRSRTIFRRRLWQKAKRWSMPIYCGTTWGLMSCPGWQWRGRVRTSTTCKSSLLGTLTRSQKKLLTGQISWSWCCWCKYKMLWAALSHKTYQAEVLVPRGAEESNLWLWHSVAIIHTLLFILWTLDVLTCWVNSERVELYAPITYDLNLCSVPSSDPSLLSILF